MARTARCPSCGAPVEFKSVVSVMAVCSYCQSALVRTGQEIANLGKMAALIEDRSPLQRGSEGRWKGVHFALIGRIQYRYDAGMWNEWCLLFDNGKSGWLSEAGGEYVLSLPRGTSSDLPRFDALHVGDDLSLDGTNYRVTNILTSECIAGEGELPFKVGSGYTAPVVDLRSEAGGFATLDYSDDPEKPLLFIGESIAFKSLGWANLREKIPIPEINVKARAFNCPSCAAPLEIRHEGILSVGCPSCGGVISTANETVQLLAKAAKVIGSVPFPALGSKAVLSGEAVEVIGYMTRIGHSDGESFRWHEWVLLGPDNRLLWLTNYQNHWNFGRVRQKAVRERGMDVSFDGKDYKHFATYSSSVECVVGEFPWQVRADETAMVEDFVAPPRMLSHETTDREENWTLLEYIEPDAVRHAFGLTARLPPPGGVYANQVNPHAETHALVFSRFWKFCLLATIVHFVLLFWGGNRLLVEQSLDFHDDDDEAVMTREFRLASRVPRIDIENQTDIQNAWMSLNVTLVNKDTGEAWHATREISQYEGMDGLEPWSEGSRSDELTFSNLPAGTYVLAEDAELGARELDANDLSFQFGSARAAQAKIAPVRSMVRISRSGPRWSSYFLLLMGLGLFPIYTRIRRYMFESSRWADSDHPHVYGSDNEDGD